MLCEEARKPLTIRRFCLPVTLRCDLRCKLCAEQSPYYEKPYHPELPELLAQLERLFALADRVDLFDLTGGEPLLRKDLHILVREIYERWGRRIGRLRVTTNGTILPPEEFLDSLQMWGDRVHIIVDHYPASQRIQAIQERLSRTNLSFEIRDYTNTLHCDGWVDYGNFSKKHDPQAAQALFEKCMVPQLDFFLCLVDGRLFPCARARLLYEQRITEDCLDIMRGDILLLQEELQRFLRPSALESCAYCNGLCEDSERFQPAEQL